MVERQKHAITGAAPDVETSSDGYARRFSGPVGEWFLGVQERACLDLVRPWRGGRVLDVGGGHAQVAVPLAREGYAVTVLGSTPACRERLDRATGRAGVEVAFETGSVVELPYADASFDVVVSFRLLAHVVGWRRLVGELCRVARHAVVVDYAPLASANVLTPLLFHVKKNVEKNTRHYLTFLEHDVRAAFRSAGYRVTGRVDEFLVPMVVHRAVGRPGWSARAEDVARRLGLTRLLGSPVILRAELGS
ncbi:MAG: class I SAM-dependent methyltransferase [Verrucomicrobia bacterium]|nr:class I SAM-dependent methyltransferase [Verrucomicrobiota bacterium]